MLRQSYVYLMTNRRNGAFYCGVTSDIIRRCQQHRSGETGGFVTRYGLRHLAWYEMHDDIRTAIAREKTIKRWPRAYKFNVIEALNPDWRDLYFSLIGNEIDECPPIPDPGTRPG